MSTPAINLPLPALQGSSLLGFLAALGAFRTLSSLPDMIDLQMSWIPSGCSYSPVLRSSHPLEPGVVIQQLHSSLASLASHYVIKADKDLKIPIPVYRKLAIRAANDFLTHDNPMSADIVASFGCDAVGNDDGAIEDTSFRTMSGAGNQHFLESIQVLAQETTPEQLREAVFGPWRYRDRAPAMRWDSQDDRRYALRWDEPSKDPIRTVRGANLLAIAALPLFPVIPTSGRSVATIGFSGRGSRETFVAWPIWTGWLGIDAVRSLLGLSEIQQASENTGSIADMRGIAAMYRSQRITLGKFRNFSPSTSA